MGSSMMEKSLFVFSSPTLEFIRNDTRLHKYHFGLTVALPKEQGLI